MRRIAKKIACRLKSKLLYKICRFYVNAYNNNSDCDMRSNGEMFLMQNFIKENYKVLDVGAGDGKWSQALLTFHKNIFLDAFEPSKKRYSQILMKELPIRAFNFAFGDKNEEVMLHHGVVGGSNSIHLSKYEPSNNSAEKIFVLPIDEWCSKENIHHIDYLKIDVDGHELSVIKGAEGLLKRGAINFIQFEYGPNYIDAGIMLKDIFEFIQSRNFNYTLFKVYPQHIEKVERYHYKHENFDLSTWLIVKS